MSFIFTQIHSFGARKICVTMFQTFSEKSEKNSLVVKIFYWTSVNLRLNPIFVLEVGNVFATNGSFIV